MEAMREQWTDERMDDLNHRVDRGFEEVNREFKTLRLEMRTEFASVRSDMRAEFAAVRSEMSTEFAAVRSEFTAVRSEFGGQMAQLNRTIIQLFGGMMATMAIGFAGLIATALTQL